MNNRLRKTLTAAVVVAGVATASSACTPDATRGRIENDVPQTFAHSYALSEQLQGHRAVAPRVDKTECHSSVNTKADSGPGSWDCAVTYTVGGKKTDVDLLVLVDQLGCYQAMDGDHRNRMITDVKTHAKVPDPKVGFDGCFDVYDGHTDTSKASS